MTSDFAANMTSLVAKRQLKFDERIMCISRWPLCLMCLTILAIWICCSIGGLSSKVRKLTGSADCEFNGSKRVEVLRNLEMVDLLFGR